MFYALPIIGAALAVGTLFVTSTDWRPATKWTLWIGLVVFCLAEATVLYWHTHPDVSQRFWQTRQLSSTSKPKAAVLIQCTIANRVAPFQTLEIFPILDTLNVEVLRSAGKQPMAMAEITTGNADTSYRPWGSFQFEHLCEITNYTKGPLFDVVIPFRLILKEAILSGAGKRSGKTVFDSVFPVAIPRIEQGPDRPFKFYAWLPSDKLFGTIATPKSLIAKHLGDERRTEVGVIDSSTAKILLEPLLKRQQPAPSMIEHPSVALRHRAVPRQQSPQPQSSEQKHAPQPPSCENVTSTGQTGGVTGPNFDTVNQGAPPK
jgi:hypothetical protein